MIKMVDISSKEKQLRRARASGTIKTSAAVIQNLKEKKVPKGDVLSVASTAAVLAAKNTAQIIPLCHPIPINNVAVKFNIAEDTISVETEVIAYWATGVELEALLSCAVALLTIYDMLKTYKEPMVLEQIRLIEKIVLPKKDPI